jgi:hypothetical protein
MIRPDVGKWNQTADDLRQAALGAAHPRTRERFLALYMIASGQTNATQWAKQTRRCDECVLKWVHTYNDHGPEALTYRRSGGSSPLLRRHRPS